MRSEINKSVDLTRQSLVMHLAIVGLLKTFHEKLPWMDMRSDMAAINVRGSGKEMNKTILKM